MTEPRANAARADDHEQPGIANQSSHSSLRTTPLLLLLDGVLSKDEARVADAMNDILYTLRVYALWNKNLINDGPSQSAPLHYTEVIESPCNSAASLERVLNALLDQYPHLAQIPSDHDGSLPLHFAASLGNVPAAVTILQSYPQGVTTRNQKGKIPLHYAAREGRTDMVQYFLQHHPETCSITTDKGKLAVHFAAGDGHTQITSLLLQAYPDSAAIPTHKGKLPLHFCARWGYMDIAYELLSIYPNAVRALDWEGSLPLHDAAREGQYLMSKYLIHQYPTALQTANLRGEIPLFSAVRSSCVDLIVLLIQSWPRSGRHVLRNVCADDYISSWNWNIIELLLRGATNNLHGCSLLVGREPPTVRLTEDIEPITVATFTVEEMKARKKAKKAAARAAIASTVPHATTQYPVVEAPNLAPLNPKSIHHTTTDATMPINQSRMNEIGSPFQPIASLHVASTVSNIAVSVHDRTPLHSSSPILQDRDKKPAANKRGVLKRPRLSGIASPISPPRTFISLHAAFECKASFYVIDRVLQERPNDVHRVDDAGRMAIHYAVAHCHDNAIVEVVLNQAYKILTPSSVRMIDGASGKLPIHIAIATGADVRIIKALLQEFPSSGVAQCRTPDYFYDKTPVHMATHYGCDVSTVFELLRVDPSFVSQHRG